MTEIRVIWSGTVQAANLKADDDGNDSAHPTLIELSPLDLSPLLRGSIQKGLLFRIPPSHDKSSVITNLRQSLSSTLDFFPPLAGRFAVVQHHDGGDSSSSFFIDCNNAGALFVEAVAPDTTVADILEPTYVPHVVSSFFPLNGLKNYEGTTNPLLGVQVTELNDGIFLGFTMNHAAVDGVSFWHFINSWSEISRGSNQISKPPLLQRWFPPDITRPIRIPFTIPPREQQNLAALSEQRLFHFPKEKIAEIKVKANTEANTDTVSSLQALLSHIWRAVIRNQSVDPEKEMSCLLGIGTRGKITRPPLPDNYFGNAVQLAGRVTMKAGEVVDEGGLGKVAWNLKKMVSSNTEEKLRSRVDSFLKEPRLQTLSEVLDDALLISSSPRFDVYGNDFGWGKPVGVRSGAGNKRFGKVTLFAGEEEGSIDIEACLSLPLLEAMGNDSEFMAFVAH
ncbi:uncharacterized acetyltransferase At3g50280-like [Neltuma alba]|uniref:uncharacterized acetyltransferase At3g50280-like n=1 Tax=Neltuma alba TaxID=207710 RepID=UPI0010A3D1DB|nr:uncharacterized acetyltransferase At3g50280-like [Prosopis alba]